MNDVLIVRLALERPNAPTTPCQVPISTAVMIAMWVAHFMLFWRDGFAAWVGLLVVTQNIVGSMFNSHLSDFTQGWLYVFGVGVFGGALLKQNAISGRFASEAHVTRAVSNPA